MRHIYDIKKLQPLEIRTNFSFSFNIFSTVQKRILSGKKLKLHTKSKIEIDDLVVQWAYAQSKWPLLP